MQVVVHEKTTAMTGLGKPDVAVARGLSRGKSLDLLTSFNTLLRHRNQMHNHNQSLQDQKIGY